MSGVAVAYKLVEALYLTLPDVPQQRLEQLLDLVAIGLIADLVALKGECRYLAQKGIEKLQQQLKNPTRPGDCSLITILPAKRRSPHRYLLWFRTLASMPSVAFMAMPVFVLSC